MTAGPIDLRAVTASEDQRSPLAEVLGSLLRTVSFRAEVFFRGQMCDEWSLDTSGSGLATFHAIGDGPCWLHLRDLPRPRHLVRGDVVLLPHDAQHAVTSSESSVPLYGGKRYSKVLALDAPPAGTELLCGYLHIPRTVQELLLSAVPDFLVIGRHAPQGDQIGRLVDAMFAEGRNSSPAATAVVERLADALLVKTFEIGIANLPEPAGFYAGLAHPRIGRAIAAAWEAPDKRWTVASLAEVAAMSRSAFAEQFQALVGKSPMDLLTSWRMQVAWQTLERDRGTVADVATKAGYETEAAFRKAFKRHFGVGPGEVRRP